MAAVLVICMAVTLTVLAKPLYYFDIQYLNIAENSGYSAEACRLNYDTLIDYNLLGGEDELIFPTLPMSQEGRIHFEEVKDIFVAMQMISLLGIIGYLAFAVFLFRYIQKSKLVMPETDYKNIKSEKYKVAIQKYILWMKYTGYVCAMIAGIVCLAMIIDWQWAFTMMHNIFFDNDYWIFNPYTDPVIKILPDEFFFHCGVLIILLVILQVVGLRIIYIKLSARVQAAASRPQMKN